MNLPKPVTANNYDKIINRVVKTAKVVADITMQDALHVKSYVYEQISPLML